MKNSDVLSVLKSISKFDNEIKPEHFIANGFVKLNGRILKENTICKDGDALQIKKEQYQFDWEYYMICA
jgi:hypothetical protein